MVPLLRIKSVNYNNKIFETCFFLLQEVSSDIPTMINLSTDVVIAGLQIDELSKSLMVLCHSSKRPGSRSLSAHIHPAG